MSLACAEIISYVRESEWKTKQGRFQPQAGSGPYNKGDL